MKKRTLDDEDAFSRRLANDPRFIEIIERSRASHEATGGISLAEMRKKYGVQAKPKRRVIRRRVKP